MSTVTRTSCQPLAAAYMHAFEQTGAPSAACEPWELSNTFFSLGKPRNCFVKLPSSLLWNETGISWSGLFLNDQWLPVLGSTSAVTFWPISGRWGAQPPERLSAVLRDMSLYFSEAASFWMKLSQLYMYCLSMQFQLSPGTYLPVQVRPFRPIKSHFIPIP